MPQGHKENFCKKFSFITTPHPSLVSLNMGVSLSLYTWVSICALSLRSPVGPSWDPFTLALSSGTHPRVLFPAAGLSLCLTWHRLPGLSSRPPSPTFCSRPLGRSGLGPRLQLSSGYQSGIPYSVGNSGLARSELALRCLAGEHALILLGRPAPLPGS